jgi:hypothetical protein
MARLVGGKTTEDVRAYVADLRYPALKHDAVHAARQKGAPNDIVALLENVPVTQFQSLDHLLQSLPEMT